MREHREARAQLARVRERSQGSGKQALLPGGAGVLALSGTASASSENGTGQIGTEERPLETLYTDGLSGPLTGEERVESLVGDGLTVEDGTLVLEGG